MRSFTIRFQHLHLLCEKLCGRRHGLEIADLHLVSFANTPGLLLTLGRAGL